MTFSDEITPPLLPERPRRRQTRESDRWSRWAGEMEPAEDRGGWLPDSGPLGGLRAFPGAA